MPLGMEVGLDPRHIMLDGDPAPPKGGTNSQFTAHVCCGQTVGWIKMPLGTEVGLSPGYIVLNGYSAAPSHKRGTVAGPHFSAHVYCRQTAGWIKMPLGTEVGLGPGHIALDGTQLPVPQKGTPASPSFGPCLL